VLQLGVRTVTVGFTDGVQFLLGLLLGLQEV
jgi:hypothetical protein